MTGSTPGISFEDAFDILFLTHPLTKSHKSEGKVHLP
jgi:hypothetical protein